MISFISSTNNAMNHFTKMLLKGICFAHNPGVETVMFTLYLVVHFMIMPIVFLCHKKRVDEGEELLQLVIKHQI